MYSAQRGAILPEAATPVGGAWKVEMAMPPSTGFSGMVRYDYTYARKGAGVAVITSTGSLDGKGPAGTTRKMTAKSTGEYRMELENGHLIGTTVDADVTVEEGGQAIVRQKVKVEWQLDESAK
jgi:hypothetical protein